MEKKAISVSFKMKGLLDDDYTLYEDGTVLHEYDRNSYPGNQNLKENLTVANLSEQVKQRLLEAASEENRDLVSKILGINND